MSVFISYSKKDEKIAHEIFEGLERKDIKCWFAPRDINVGENWANQIVTAIEQSTNFVVILSENSMKSNEVLKELTLASEMKKNVFALCVNGCEPSRGYKYHLSIAQRLNVSEGIINSVIEKLEEKITGRKTEYKTERRQAVQAKRTDKVEIVTYQDLVRRGFNSAQIAEQLVANDRVLYPHIDDENEGDVSQWEEYLSSYPQTFKYMVNADNQIVGNWSIVILSKEDYKKAVSGQMVEAELQVKDTAYFMFGGVYYGYLLNMSVNREYMNPANIRLLFESFLDQLEEFAEDDIFFKSWCVNVFLPDHEKRYEQLGFKYKCDNVKSGKIYVMDLVPYPGIPMFRKKRKLKKLYEDKFRVDCRQLEADDYLDEEQLEQIAGLIYDTDEYIYPAMFESREDALELIPELMQNGDAMFCQENLYIAEYEDEIAGILLWKKGPLHWSQELFEQTAEERNIPVSPYLNMVTKRYINSYAGKEREDIISIINLCVSEEARGMGIGKKLMETFLRQHRGEKMELCVLEENKCAVQLYKKMGFKEMSKYQGFSVDEQNIVCIGMKR